MLAENKKTIARELDKPMHTFLYLFGHGNKFDSKTQQIFELLNEWTLGNIWDNLIIVYNRASFTLKKVNDRYETMFDYGPEKLFWKMKNDQLSFIKATLSQIAKQKKWMRLINTEGNQRSRLMRKQDFDNIKISALNFEQAHDCTLVDGFVSPQASDCWKLPIIDMNYDYKDDPFNPLEPQLSNDQFVFTTEMRKLYNMIKQNANHPVITQKEYFQSEFAKDLEQYNLRAGVMHADIVDTVNKTQIDVKHCEKGFEKIQHGLKNEFSCPTWSTWTNWSNCQICGYSQKFRDRNCTRDDLIIEKEKCLKDLPDKETRQEEYCQFKPCNFTEWRDESVCSSSCGLGFKRQSRKCQGLASDCIGETERNIPCQISVCPEWASWTKWSNCETCGHATRFRNRDCTKNNLVIQKEECLENLSDKQTHQEEYCSYRPCDFSEWVDKSVCSSTCGEGFKQQSRICKGLASDCFGDTERTIPCKIDTCPTWAKWTNWSQCSRTCGESFKTRSRSCFKNALHIHSDNCRSLSPGTSAKEERLCSFKSCGFTQWKDKTKCSASCGRGLKEQTRHCKARPMDCIGENSRMTLCEIRPCLTYIRECK